MAAACDESDSDITRLVALMTRRDIAVTPADLLRVRERSPTVFSFVSEHAVPFLNLIGGFSEKRPRIDDPESDEASYSAYFKALFSFVIDEERAKNLVAICAPATALSRLTPKKANDVTHCLALSMAYLFCALEKKGGIKLLDILALTPDEIAECSLALEIIEEILKRSSLTFSALFSLNPLLRSDIYKKVALAMQKGACTSSTGYYEPSSLQLTILGFGSTKPSEDDSESTPVR